MATITQAQWKRYITRLRQLNEKAEEEFKKYVSDNLGYANIERQNLIDTAYAIANKYGESSAALSAEMYDAIAELSGANVPAAVPAEISYHDVAKTVNGTIKNTGSEKELARNVSLLVKKAGTDTTLSNAYRDGPKGKGSKRKHSGAQVAWVPTGDTCSFCLLLASKGWVNQTDWGSKNHKDHIHANCDCTYAVRFDNKSSVEGYDPDKYKEIYENAEGETRNEKFKSLSRAYRERNKERINFQKREAYADDKINKALQSIKSEDVTAEYLKKATPKRGSIITQSDFKDANGETAIANWLFDNFGGNIEKLAENRPDGELNPDYLWNDHYWDLKKPQKKNENTVDKRIQHGIRQIKENTGGVIIDFSDSPFGFAEGIELVDRFGQKRAKETTDFIVKKNNDYRVIRVKK